MSYSYSKELVLDIQRLFVELMKTKLDKKASSLIFSVLQQLIQKEQYKIAQDIKNILEKNDDVMCKAILDRLAPKNTTISKDVDSEYREIDAAKMAYEDIQLSDQDSLSESGLGDKSDVDSNELKDQFKSFYHSFLKESIKSLLINCEKNSPLGIYSIKIDKTKIDFRNINDGMEKKIIYSFDTADILLNGQMMPTDYFPKFYKLMEQVSKDVKSNIAQLYEEIDS